MKKQTIAVAIATVVALSFSSCMKKPMACVDSATKTGTVGQSVSFDAGCSMNAMHYQWDFGDGATASGASATTTHAYNSAGTFTTKVKAMSKNMKKEDEKTITVTIN